MRVPDAVRTVAEQVAPAWLAELPSVVADLSREWSLTVVGEPLGGGTRSYVARVRTAGGADAVLKVSVPEDDGPQRISALRAADGRGYALVLRADTARCAVLLEALGPSLDALGWSPEQQIDALCATLRRAWRAAPDTAPSVLRGVLRAKADALGELVARLWEEQGRPCSARVVGRALSYARRRAADPAEPAVVHGDPHPGNLLQIRIARPGAESGFVFVDPDGFVAPRAYDLGVVVRDWCPQLSTGDARATAWGYCARAAAQTGAAAQAVWEWGFLERVSSGLYACSLGLADIGEPFLATAERLTPDRTRTTISAW